MTAETQTDQSTPSNGRPSDRFPGLVSVVVVMLLTLHAGLLAYAATRHSPTYNEPGHLVAGIYHWQFGRFDLYRVNPPLVHLVAALPVLAGDAETDWNNYFEYPGARQEFAIGEDFVAANGERSIWLFTLARWACIPFSLMGGYICYRWSSELYGAGAGLLAVALWCFSPNILAHAELVTPDVAATSLGVAAGYMFWRWLKSPTWTRAVLAGIALGLAELTKLTWIILFGLWPLMWAVWVFAHRRTPHSGRTWLSQFAQLGLMVLLGVYLLNLAYGFSGTGSRLGSFTFASSALKGSGAENGGAPNRFSDTPWAGLPIPVPSDYLLGIDIQKGDFEDFGRPSYLRGRFQERGWWYYYVYAAAVKVPLGTWGLVCGAVIYSIATRRCGSTLADTFILLTPAVVVFVLVSSQTGFSHHFRYVLPCFPFLFIWTSQVSRVLTAVRWQGVLVGALILWSIGSSLWYFPHSLSYFNELAGGPRGGHAHLIHSNIDWGQDLLYLKRWWEKHHKAEPLHLAYYGHFDPASLGMKYTRPPQHSLESQEQEAKLIPLEPGWYAVSVNYLRGYPRGGFVPGAFTYFQEFEPVATAGYSIYIYLVTEEDVKSLNGRLTLRALTHDLVSFPKN